MEEKGDLGQASAGSSAPMTCAWHYLAPGPSPTVLGPRDPLRQNFSEMKAQRRKVPLFHIVNL